MIDVQLTYNAVYKWKTIEPISVIGYAFLDDILLKDDELITYFLEVKNEEEFIEKIKKLSGHFAVIIQTEKETFVAVDHIRSFPILIQKNENKITITDNPINNHSYNKNAIADFEKIYCTQENET